MTTDWGRIHRIQARHANSLAGLASGHGWYELANELWRFEGYLKSEAKRIEVRVRIDLNSRDRDGYVRARLTNVSGGPVHIDDEVTAYEPDDQIAVRAKVVRIESDRGFIYLDVYWNTFAGDDYELYLSRMQEEVRKHDQ